MAQLDILERHRETWRHKKILRVIYEGWYRWILKDLAAGRGQTIELGAGSGNFKEFKPEVIASDITPRPWLDICFDAHHMPFLNNHGSNIIMIDVLHHLADPIGFFQEAARVLEQGGRVILLEPFPSPFSLFIYRRFHPEPFIMDMDYLKTRTNDNPGNLKKDPWDANQAVAYLLFYKAHGKFLHLLDQRYHSSFKLIKRKRLGCILYPASGGFENNALIPDWAIPLFKVLEILLTPFRWLLAFRCYVVLEKC